MIGQTQVVIGRKQQYLLAFKDNGRVLRTLDGTQATIQAIFFHLGETGAEYVFEHRNLRAAHTAGKE